MNIVVTNDDGIFAEGIEILVNTLKEKGHEVYVVAPDRERSASGQAITLHSPLRITEHSKWEGVKAYSVDGTPTDCTKLAIMEIIKEPIDLLISGINRGPNLGTDVLYSGTVSAAIEGALLGIPSIAVSMAGFVNLNYRYGALITEKIALEMKKNGVPKDTLLNINIPVVETEKISGIKVTSLGQRRYKNPFHKRQDPRGNTYYWMAGEIEDYLDDPNTDVAKIKENYITISPIHFDFTNYNLMDMINRWKLNNQPLP